MTDFTKCSAEELARVTTRDGRNARLIAELKDEATIPLAELVRRANYFDELMDALDYISCDDAPDGAIAKERARALLQRIWDGK